MEVTRRNKGTSHEVVEPNRLWPANLWSSVFPELREGEEPEAMVVIVLIRTGLPGSVLGKVAEYYQLPKKEMCNILNISPKTAQRWHAKRLDTDKSDHLVQLIKVLARARQVFQDDKKAMVWLKTPCYALNDQAPVSFLDTTEGIELVLDTMGRIEYGVFV